MAIYNIDGGLKDYNVVSTVDDLYELLLQNWPSEGKKIEVAVAPAKSNAYASGTYDVEVSWEMEPEDSVKWDDDQLVLEIVWRPEDAEGYPENYALDFSDDSPEAFEKEALESFIYFVAEEMFETISDTFAEHMFRHSDLYQEEYGEDWSQFLL